MKQASQIGKASTAQFTQLCGQLTPLDEDCFSITIPQGWMQGRTTYGGMSAALCLETVIQDYTDLPPLRSAHVTFVGPAGGEVLLRTKKLRQGRNVGIFQVDMLTGEQVVNHAVVLFGKSRASEIDHESLQAPNILDRLDEVRNLPDPHKTYLPAFANHFHIHRVGGVPLFSGADQGEIVVFVKHRDSAAKGNAALIALADMPPPSIYAMLSKPAPNSSMNWALNFLQEKAESKDGWWLIRSRTERGAQGYASQDMTVWNSDGLPVISSRQAVAVFEQIS